MNQVLFQGTKKKWKWRRVSESSLALSKGSVSLMDGYLFWWRERAKRPHWLTPQLLSSSAGKPSRLHHSWLLLGRNYWKQANFAWFYLHWISRKVSSSDCVHACSLNYSPFGPSSFSNRIKNEPHWEQANLFDFASLTTW